MRIMAAVDTPSVIICSWFILTSRKRNGRASSMAKLRAELP